MLKKELNKSGSLNLEITNTNQSESITVDGGLRETETSATKDVNFSMAIDNKYNNALTLEMGYLFDIGFRIHSGTNNTPDDLFMSDGSWGIDDAATSTEVNEFVVMPHLLPIQDDGLIVERGVTLSASTSEFISVYKSFYTYISASRFNPIQYT